MFTRIPLRIACSIIGSSAQRSWPTSDSRSRRSGSARGCKSPYNMQHMCAGCFNPPQLLHPTSRLVAVDKLLKVKRAARVFGASYSPTAPT